MNFVQGSWPEYHPEYVKAMQHEPLAVLHMRAMDSEYQTLRATPLYGLSLILRRLALDPTRYALWYLSKPIELWGWNIGIGQGDIYVFPTANSPLAEQSGLRLATGVCFFLSPFLMLLALAGAARAFWPHVKAPLGMQIAGALGLFVTLVFGILQSDSRYATPFRGIEMTLAVSTVTAGMKWMQSIKQRKAADAN